MVDIGKVNEVLNQVPCKLQRLEPSEMRALLRLRMRKRLDPPPAPSAHMGVLAEDLLALIMGGSPVTRARMRELSKYYGVVARRDEKTQALVDQVMIPENVGVVVDSPKDFLKHMGCSRWQTLTNNSDELSNMLGTTEAEREQRFRAAGGIDVRRALAMRIKGYLRGGMTVEAIKRMLQGWQANSKARLAKAARDADLKRHRQAANEAAEQAAESDAHECAERCAELLYDAAFGANREVPPAKRKKVLLKALDHLRECVLGINDAEREGASWEESIAANNLAAA